MSKIDIFLLVVPRETSADFSEFLSAAGCPVQVSMPCRGTAGSTLLERFGLQRSEKVLVAAPVPHRETKRLMQRCIMNMGLNLPGSGIAVSVPMESIGGASSLNAISAGWADRLTEEKEEATMETRERTPYTLLVAVMDSGWADKVMDAARGAGAGGGTIVHAKGTAGAMAKKFLGVSIAEEKELLLIVLNQKNRPEVMHAIMDKAGNQSEAHTVLFSLPVEEVGGLRSVMEEETDESV